MGKRILLILGHPDPSAERFGHALAACYAEAAQAAGHEIRRIVVAEIDFPLLRSKHDWENGDVPASLRAAQQEILWAGHLVFFFPLWLGGLPAKLKGFFEQAFRYGFALSAPGQKMRGLLKGRSVRMIVTMGMPALFFRCVFGAYGVRAVERGMLRISGFRPVRSLFIGGVGGPRDFGQWVRKVEALGAAAR